MKTCFKPRSQLPPLPEPGSFVGSLLVALAIEGQISIPWPPSHDANAFRVARALSRLEHMGLPLTSTFIDENHKEIRLEFGEMRPELNSMIGLFIYEHRKKEGQRYE